MHSLMDRFFPFFFLCCCFIPINQHKAVPRFHRADRDRRRPPVARLYPAARCRQRQRPRPVLRPHSVERLDPAASVVPSAPDQRLGYLRLLSVPQLLAGGRRSERLARVARLCARHQRLVRLRPLPDRRHGRSISFILDSSAEIPIQILFHSIFTSSFVIHSFLPYWTHPY